jgi:hypothetical protein
MAALFSLLFLACIGLLTWGLIAPKSLAKHANKATKKELTRKHFAVFFGVASFVMLILVGMTAPTKAQGGQQPKPTPAVVAPKAPVVTTKQETETKPVAFSSSSVNDATMEAGTSKVTTVGVNGVETLTYKVTYTDGKQTARNLVGGAVTTQPVAQVTSVGTYVAPAPVAAPTYTAPTTGARTGAICNDGTSSTATGSGACSHHHGVAYWTYN